MFLLRIILSLFLFKFIIIGAYAGVFDLRKNYVDYVEKNAKIHEDAVLTVPELIRKYGYPCEEHTVVTPDGYMLTMHRIPYGNVLGNEIKRPVVFLQHGILASSADWVVTGTSKGLAYLLANAGYDVWMGNVRGNRYSRQHIYLNPDEEEAFWDFSWHEMAIFDLPTMIDYILDQTLESKLTYVGHSQGNTVFYVMCSELPTYNDKIKAQFSLAPVAYMEHMKSPILRFLSYFKGPLGDLFNLIGLHEFLPQSEFTAKFADTFCGEDDVSQILCTNVLFLLCGFDKEQLNATLLPVILGHTPAGASTKQLLHFAQLIKSGKFRRWDYGISGNFIHYGSLSPPSYKLSNVKVPVFLFHSSNDWLAAEEDVLRLYRELGNPKASVLVPNAKFNHLDFIFAVDTKPLLYDFVVALMKGY